jgi:hypothetical protein
LATLFLLSAISLGAFEQDLIAFFAFGGAALFFLLISMLVSDAANKAVMWFSAFLVWTACFVLYFLNAGQS